MLASANALDIIPVDVSIEFFKSVVVSSRAKERGYNFFINGYMQLNYFHPLTKSYVL